MADSVLAWIGGLVAGAAAGVAVTYLATGGGQSTGSPATAGATGPVAPAAPSPVTPTAPPVTPGTPVPGTPTATSTPTTPPPVSPWVHPTGDLIPANAHIRLSITPSQLTTMLQADDKALPSNMNGLYAALIGQLPSTVAGWPWIGKTPTIYPPGTPLPSDWPSDEPNAKDNWHVDMVLTSGPFGVHQQIDAVVWIYDLTLLQATKG